MHGTTNITYSPMNHYSPSVGYRFLKPDISFYTEPNRNGFRSPKSFQISPNITNQKNNHHRDGSHLSPSVHEFQLQNKVCYKSGICNIQKDNAINLGNCLRKSPNFNMTPKPYIAKKQDEKVRSFHLSPQHSFFDPEKPQDKKIYQKKGQKQSVPNFQKVSAYFHSSPNLHQQTTKASHSAILSPENREIEGIKKPQNHFKIIENKQGQTLKKAEKKFNQKPRGDKEELFSTYQSSKPESQFIQEEKKNAGKESKIIYSHPNRFQPIKQLLLRPRQVSKSEIYQGTADLQNKNLIKSNSKGKVLFMKSPQKLSHSQTITLNHSASLASTLPIKNETSKKLELTKNFTKPLYSSQNLIKAEKSSTIIKPPAMEDIKENGETGFEQEDSVCLRTFSLKDFQFVEKIGKGNFGSVSLVREKQSRMLCVLKCLSKKKIKDEGLEEHVMREIKIQTFLNHPHIAPLYGFFDDEEKIYLIMEYMHDGSLLHNKRKRTEEEIANILKQICSGLAYMHKENIIHRDIKPENILMNENFFKIGDLGCAVFSDSLRRTLVGCLAYISPEQLDEKPYDDKIDAWCMGIMAYELLVGRAPFEDHLKKKIIERQDFSQFPVLSYPQELNISSQAKDFIQKLLQKDPMIRYSMKDALKHTFLQKHKENMLRIPQ